MSALETAGVEFVAGNGGGPGVRQREGGDSIEEFLSFLRLYDHNRLRAQARNVNGLPQFGYAFVYINREGADLMYRGKRLGQVRWSHGRISFDPPLFDGTQPSLSDEIFDRWVSRAEYRNSTGL